MAWSGRRAVDLLTVAGGLGGAVAAGAAVVALAGAGPLSRALRHLLTDPPGAGAGAAGIALAFTLRAVAWSRVLAGLPVHRALAGIWMTAAANKVLSLRAGEAVRVWWAHRAGHSWADAAASTLTLRAADGLAAVVLVAVLAPRAALGVAGPVVAVAVAVAAGAGTGAGWWWLRRLRGDGAPVRPPDPLTMLAVLAAWFAEAAAAWAGARAAGVDAGPQDALTVAAVSVAAQAAAVLPAGVGTYEAAAAGTWMVLGVAPGPALVAAVVTHTLTTAVSVAGGAVAWWWRPRSPRRPEPVRVTTAAPLAGSDRSASPADRRRRDVGGLRTVGGCPPARGASGSPGASSRGT